uniref:Uncharacterized protein n=1 Tax=Chromera velia CCMP2878 TaxID=1169474 RepID=A0A0G4F960_9ALVE|eukprot:Cvel_15732.t1-p1 / transcript=Cvel_15732.t1 / gene=Cvel_15732 / organism=Chromera_velia_CCMP2878 / gene_product=hypothetical protein / transcript_product=hypothetical protein / location=Cvel_scaffold1176:46879-48813(-) / protein_length=645 / sequence_SO=supercontig / SO=protein_coding / is_pseudo=false
MAAEEADFLSLLVQTGILGLRGFWKLSAVSKELLSLRGDATALGFGSVCSGFSSVTEKLEVWRLIDDCLRRDDVKALQQLFALPGVSGRFPFLLRRLIEKSPDSEKCRTYLMERGVTPCVTEILYTQRTSGGTNLSKKIVDEMISRRMLQADAWAVFPARGDDFVVFDPLSVHFLKNNRFDLAESLLDAGSRVDVCGWVWRGRYSRVLDVGVTPLQCLVQRLLRLDSEEHALRQKGLALLERIVRASKAAGCLDWKFEHDHRREGTALGLACLCRDAEIVRVLGGVTDRVDQEGLPFLILTGDDNPSDSERLSQEKVDSCCADTLEELANIRGVNLNAVRRDGHTPLSLACFLGLKKSAAVLLKRGALPKRVKGRGGRMSLSPLYEALRTRSQTFCSLLLQWEADPNEVVVEGAAACTLLQSTLLNISNPRADRKVTAALAKRLIENGARACVLSSPPPPTTENGQTGTPPLNELSMLLMACQTGDADLVRLLVTKGGGDPNAKGKTREMDAAEYPVFLVLSYFRRHSVFVILSLLKTLAKVGADLNVDRGDGHSLLSFACHHLCGSVVLEFLLEKGVQVGGLWREGGAGPDPLVEAVASLCPENVRVLPSEMKWGAEANHAARGCGALGGPMGGSTSSRNVPRF